MWNDFIYKLIGGDNIDLKNPKNRCLLRLLFNILDSKSNATGSNLSYSVPITIELALVGVESVDILLLNDVSVLIEFNTGDGNVTAVDGNDRISFNSNLYGN